MRRVIWRAVLVLAFPVALTAPVLTRPASAAQSLSAGCQAVNDPRLDGLYSTSGVAAGTAFGAGERITVSAGLPTFGPPTDRIRLAVNVTGGAIIDTTFPGTITFTFPAATTGSLFWGVFDGFATWTVTCDVAPDPKQMISDLRDLVAGLGIHHGTANALDAKLQAALAALGADDTASACVALQDFLNLVSAQTDKKLSDAQAAELTDAANAIRVELGC